MTPLDEINRLIQTAAWFSNLGRADSGIPIRDLKAWQQFHAAAVSVEFSLPHDAAIFEKFPFSELEWLPTSRDQEDPIHGSGLVEIAEKLGITAPFKAARLEVTKLALTALRNIPESPWLKVGATDLTEAARGAALFACRAAASEAIIGQPGFWVALLAIYHCGNWPVGRVRLGEVVVI